MSMFSADHVMFVFTFNQLKVTLCIHFMVCRVSNINKGSIFASASGLCDSEGRGFHDMMSLCDNLG